MFAALLPTLGPMEMVVLLVIIMIFFGVGKLPEVGKSLGGTLKAFKDAQKPDALDVTDDTEPEQIADAVEVEAEKTA